MDAEDKDHYSFFYKSVPGRVYKLDCTLVHMGTWAFVSVPDIEAV